MHPVQTAKKKRRAARKARIAYLKATAFDKVFGVILLSIHKLRKESPWN